MPRSDRITHTLESLLALCAEVGECLEWTAATNGAGHPCVRHNGKVVLARRLAAELGGMAMSGGMLCVPSCENPLCINPQHLVLRTPSAVMRRQGELGKLSEPHRRAKMAAKMRALCSELDWPTVRAIRAHPGSHAEAAQAFGLTYGRAWKIRMHKAWQELEANPWLGLGSKS